MDYTKLIKKAADNKDWIKVCKLAKEAMLDTDDSYFGLKKGVVNVLITKYIDYKQVKYFTDTIKAMGFTVISLAKIADYNSKIKDNYFINNLDKNIVVITPIISGYDLLYKESIPAIQLRLYEKNFGWTPSKKDIDIANDIRFEIINYHTNEKFNFGKEEKAAINRDCLINEIFGK